MKSLIVVDIQPFYHEWHKHITPDVLEYIMQNAGTYENILWFFNAQEVGIQDTSSDVINYIYEYGILDDESIDNIYFIDKYYAFFRNWMDAGVEEEFIQKVLRYMIKRGYADSREIDDFAMEMLIETFYDVPEGADIREEYDYLWTDNIHIPHFKWDAIKDLKEVDVCGGGRNECLKEMEILLEVVGVEFDRLENLIYGE